MPDRGAPKQGKRAAKNSAPEKKSGLPTLLTNEKVAATPRAPSPRSASKQPSLVTGAGGSRAAIPRRAIDAASMSQTNLPSGAATVPLSKTETGSDHTPAPFPRDYVAGPLLSAARALTTFKIEKIAELSLLSVATIRRAEGAAGKPNMTKANLDRLLMTYARCGVFLTWNPEGRRGVFIDPKRVDLPAPEPSRPGKRPGRAAAMELKQRRRALGWPVGER